MASDASTGRQRVVSDVWRRDDGAGAACVVAGALMARNREGFGQTVGTKEVGKWALAEAARLLVG